MPGSYSALLIVETGEPFLGGFYMAPQFRVGFDLRQVTWGTWWYVSATVTVLLLQSQQGGKHLMTGSGVGCGKVKWRPPPSHFR